MRLCFAGVLVTPAAWSAQSVPAPDRVEGFAGQVEVTPAVDRNHTTVTFTPDAAGGGRLLAFILQHPDGAKLPPAWSGKARLFRAHGFLAFAGADGSRMAFKFPERAVPASLAKQVFDEYQVFGIAVYGEELPIGTGALANLKKSGVYGSSIREKRAGPGGDAQRLAEGCEGVQCTSGGIGATACSVTAGATAAIACQPGLYACCDAEALRCVCCKSPQ
jgi:hypothetical protein